MNHAGELTIRGDGLVVGAGHRGLPAVLLLFTVLRPSVEPGGRGEVAGTI